MKSCKEIYIVVVISLLGFNQLAAAGKGLGALGV